MRSSFEAVGIVYGILNSQSITDLIDGNIYRERRKLYSEGEKRLQDIVILPLVNQNTYIQNGYLNVNIYSRDLGNGTPDSVKLKAITDAATAALEAYSGESGGYFELEVENQNTYQEERGESYVNLRVQFLMK